MAEQFKIELDESSCRSVESEVNALLLRVGFANRCVYTLKQPLVAYGEIQCLKYLQ